MDNTKIQNILVHPKIWNYFHILYFEGLVGTLAALLFRQVSANLCQQNQQVGVRGFSTDVNRTFGIRLADYQAIISSTRTKVSLLAIETDEFRWYFPTIWTYCCLLLSFYLL